MARAYLVGSGIASLSAAAFLIREGKFAGGDITILGEDQREGGALDAGGSPQTGYTMRGGRMFELHFQCTWDLLSSIPSLNDPAKSVTQDTFSFHEDYPWQDVARLMDKDGKIVRAHTMGFSERDRLDLVKCASTPEKLLDGKRITDCFSKEFFSTNFWHMWCTTFAFEPWHSAIEMHRYLNRFVHLFKEFDTMAGIYRTRYTQYHSIVLPLVSWLRDQGVTMQMNTRVTDLKLAEGKDITVEAITWQTGGKTEQVPVGASDLVFVTNGSIVANSTLGGTDTVATLDTSKSSGAWQLWESLAAKRPGVFGNPAVFDGHIDDSKWISFTVTTKDPTFFNRMVELTDRRPGQGGMITLKDSNWLLTTALTHQPQYSDQPKDTFVWWAYALYPEKVGNFIDKPMAECTGAEMADELLQHLRFEERQEIIDNSTVIPAMMPYITSQFLVRRHGDRPEVVPPGCTNLAFVGQFTEVPDDVVFTVEYSVRTAWTAVARLLKLSKQPPPVYKGKHNPKVLLEALEAMHRR